MTTIGGQGGRSVSLGGNDPRNRRTPQQFASPLNLAQPLRLDRDGRISIDPRGIVPPAYFDETRGTIGLRLVSVAATRAITARPWDTILADPTAAGFTVMLPPAQNCPGSLVTVKNNSASTNTITIDGAGGDLIDGAATATITTARASLTMQSIGTGWVLV